MTTKPQTQTQGGFAHPSYLAAIATVLLGGATLAPSLFAQDLPKASAVMSAVDQRDEGITQRSNITFELTDRRGKSRVQETLALRKYYGKDKRQVLFYLEPSNVRDTAFLTYDYAEASRDDDQWLYLPALRKSRRISASDRGDYFLGTDLTYEDLKRQNKVSLDDWNFQTVGHEQVQGTETVVIEGQPVSEAIAEELGYSQGRWYVNTSNNTIVKSENWDIQGNHSKTANFSDIRQVDGIWTVHDITVENHKTGHKTHLITDNVAYGVEVRDGTFEERTLRRGVRD